MNTCYKRRRRHAISLHDNRIQDTLKEALLPPTIIIRNCKIQHIKVYYIHTCHRPISSMHIFIPLTLARITNYFSLGIISENEFNSIIMN